MDSVLRASRPSLLLIWPLLFIGQTHREIVMKKLVLIVGAFAVLSTASWAATEVDGPSTVSLITAQNVVTAFQLTNRVGSADCNLGLVFLDITTDQGKAEFDAILTAQAEGTQVTINYEQVGAACTLNFVNRLAN